MTPSRPARDAREILGDLARRSALATSRAELAREIEARLREALRPASLHVFLRDPAGRLACADGTGADAEPLEPDDGALAALARDGRCWHAPGAPHGEAVPAAVFARLGAECVAPVTDRAGALIGMLVVGPRRSREPYSEEDRRLLLAFASQSGIALEALRMAEEIAGRLEAEKRVAREIAIARDVQGRLLPQSAPALQGLELAVRCEQARSVGGDFYDFLELGPGQVGLVLADVSGKGIQAALLMANLQAHVRSQTFSAPQDPLRALRHVNHMLLRSTAPEHFATLFLGVWSDATRRLSYVNCGHNPPFVLHRDGRLESLGATATVLGAFEDWACTLGRAQLAPGDLVVAYSDGITEADRGGEHFGEERLVGLLREHAAAGVEALADAILASVRAFGDGEQSDDRTLLVARAR